MPSYSKKEKSAENILLEGIIKILREAVLSETKGDIAKKCLAMAEEITSSKFGFIGEINEMGRHDTIALSDPGWKECEMPSSSAAKLIKNMEIRGIWGDVIKKEKSIIVNDPTSYPNAVGIPKGHPKLTSFLGVPLKRVNKTVGIIVLANKESGYDLKDQEAIESLSFAFVEALYAKRVEEKIKSEEQLNQIFSSLKDTVFIISNDFTILFKNETAQEIFGENLVGRKCYEVIKGEDSSCVRCPIKTIIEKNVGQVRFEQKIKFSHTNETKYFDIIMSPIENYGGQNAFVELLRDNTANRKLREKLEESEEKYRSLYDSIKEGIFLTDMEGKILEANQAYLDMLGYAMEEIKGMNYQQLTPEKWYEREADIVKNQILTRGYSNDYEKENIKKDGTIFPISIRVWLIKDKDGIPTGMWRIVRDITERVRSEKELEEQKEWLQITLSSIGDAVIATDINSNILFMNSAAEKLTGWTIKEVKNKSINEIFKIYNEKTGKPAENPVKRVIREGTVVGLANHTILISKDGTKINIADSGAPIIHKGNKIIGVVLVFRDITEEYTLRNAIEQSKKELENLNKQLEQKVKEKTEDLVKTMEKLKNSEEKYRTMITNLDEGFYNVTLQGTLLDHNKRFNEILGFDISKDLKGVQLPDFWQNPAERDPYKQELIKNGYIKNYLIKAKKQNGENIVVSANSHIIFDQNGVPIRIEGAFNDRTKEYFLEQDLGKSLEELKRSNTELEQFAYVASHDLQEPLRMVASFTQLLAKRYKDKLDQDANDFINFAVDGATRMQNLINDLLTFSRVGTHGKIFTSTDTNIILKTVLNNLRASIEETKAKITYDLLPVIIADDSQMMQLFQNLISNAIKFHRMDVSPEIHVSAEVKKNDWFFYVRDNGIGIDHRFFDRLFVIFQRLHKKDEYGGTGIGLAVCKKIIQRHGGKIWIESEPGKGSTFYFTIHKKEIVYNNQEKTIG